MRAFLFLVLTGNNKDLNQQILTALHHHFSSGDTPRPATIETATLGQLAPLIAAHTWPDPQSVPDIVIDLAPLVSGNLLTVCSALSRTTMVVHISKETMYQRHVLHDHVQPEQPSALHVNPCEKRWLSKFVERLKQHLARRAGGESIDATFGT